MNFFKINDGIFGQHLFMAVTDNIPNNETGLNTSRLLEWDKNTKRFVTYQEFDSDLAFDMRHFEYQGVHYLGQGASDFSRIYRWEGNSSVSKFKLYRSMPSDGDRAVQFLNIPNNPALLIMRGNRGSNGSNTLSRAFRFE